MSKSQDCLLLTNQIKSMKKLIVLMMMMVFGLSVGFAQNKTGESEARPENVEPSTPGGPVTPASPVKPVVSNKKRPTLRGGTMNLPAGASLPAGGAVKKPAGANLPGNNSAMGRPDNRSVENEQPLLPNVGNGSPTGMPVPGAKPQGRSGVGRSQGQGNFPNAMPNNRPTNNRSTGRLPRVQQTTRDVSPEMKETPVVEEVEMEPQKR